MRLLAAAIVSALLVAVAMPAAAQVPAQGRWQRSDYSLLEALQAGYQVIDTYHTGEGHLVFVLQLQASLVLCTFAEVQQEKCVELK